MQCYALIQTMMDMNTKDLLFNQATAILEDASANKRVATDYFKVTINHSNLAEGTFVMIGSTPRMDNYLTTPLHKTSGTMPNGFHFA